MAEPRLTSPAHGPPPASVVLLESRELLYSAVHPGVVVRTYAEAGVDIDRKSAQVAALVKELRFQRRGVGKPFGPKGHFAGFIELGRQALGLCTDSVGTKVLVANEMRRWDTVGYDCVAANVNDMVCAGAEPIAFVDYLVVDSHDAEMTRQIGVGLNAGAKDANVTIVGGEIAVMPEVVNGFDLAGTCFGIVDKAKIVDGHAIRIGDEIVGLASSGIHCNGLTLARRVLREAAITVMDAVTGSDEAWGPALLEPTRIYVPEVLDMVRTIGVTGLANITGGGLRNLIRLKPNVEFRLTDPMRPQVVFTALQKLAGIEDREMYQTFNMGMGLAVVARPTAAAKIEARYRKRLGAKVVGEVAKGRGVTVPHLGIRYESY